MVLVENLLGQHEVALDLALPAPRQAQQPVEIVAHHRCLRRHRAHGLELLELAIGLVARFLAELGRLDALFEFRELVRTLLAVAQFALDRLHLLVEVVLALRLFHLALDARADALFDLQHADLAFHQPHDLLEPFGHRKRREQVFLLVDLDHEVACNGVGQPRGVLDLPDGSHHFGRNLLVELDIVAELGLRRTGQGLNLGRTCLGLVKHRCLGLEVVRGLQIGFDVWRG